MLWLPPSPYWSRQRAGLLQPGPVIRAVLKVWRAAQVLGQGERRIDDLLAVTDAQLQTLEIDQAAHRAVDRAVARVGVVPDPQGRPADDVVVEAVVAQLSW